MATTKEQKKEILKNLKDKIKKAKSVLFIKFNGLGVKENEALRKELKQEEGDYMVAKKTLIDIAFKEENHEVGAKSFEGQVATVFGYNDEVAPAKILGKFIKGNEGKIEFISGILDNKIIDAKAAEALTKIPSKNELYAKMVGSLNAPISGFVNVLAGNLRGLVTVLKAIEEKKA